MDLRPLHEKGVRASEASFDTRAYRRDLWPRTTLQLTRGVVPAPPGAVAWPRTAEDVASILAWASDQGVPVVPYGAGSGVTGGAGPRPGCLTVDLKAFRGVRALDRDARIAVVGAGTNGQILEDALAREGLMVGHSPSSIGCSTVGGWLAARGAGQFSSRYGTFDDIAVAAHLVAPSGPRRVGAWTKGREEDLLPVVSGSEGGLGIVTEVAMRVTPLPPRRWLRGYAFPSTAVAVDAMRDVMQSGVWPSVLRLYDPVDRFVGGRVDRDLRAEVAKEAGLARALPLALPGLVNRIARGVARQVVLIVGLEGDPDVVEASIDLVRVAFRRGRDLGAEPGERWYTHRHDVSYRLAPLFADGSFADTMEVAAPWSRLLAVEDAIRQALSRHALVMAHLSHAYPEGCSIYFTFVGRGDLEVYDAAWRDALQAARDSGATLSHHHGVGDLKGRQAAREVGAAIRAWWDIKAELDPAGIMNPDRPFPRGVPIPPGPVRPEGGPLFALQTVDGTARVDPHARVADIEAALASRGYKLRVRPDRGYVAFVRALRRGCSDRHDVPVLGVQARFADGASVLTRRSPRSAVGPDLRIALAHRAELEMVEVPVVPQTTARVTPKHGLDARDVMPAATDDGAWVFAGSGASVLARAVGGEPTTSTEPLPATAPRPAWRGPR